MSQEHTKNPSPAAGTSQAPGHWRQALSLATGLLLAGCSDGTGPAAQTSPEATPQQKVAQLEVSGQLPPLERLPLLGGMDANRDGVRDDIALHIEKTTATRRSGGRRCRWLGRTRTSCWWTKTISSPCRPLRGR